MLSSVPIECPGDLLRMAKESSVVPTAVVNAGSELPLQSARLAFEKGLIEPVLVGDIPLIKAVARQIDWDISNLRVVAANNEIAAARVSVSLAKHGEVASLIKGNLHTDNLLRAVLDKRDGLRTGSRLSHVFHMKVPHSEKPICITDAAINVLPNLDVKLDIARNAVALLHALGNLNPKVAVLSATEQVTDKVPSSAEADELSKLAAGGAIEGAVVDGPLAFDIAVSREAARVKRIDSAVAGQADVLLVPNIEAGNFLFKQMVHFMSASAAGIVMGASVPIILTSRADGPHSRLAACALASVYAGKKRAN